MHRLIRRIAVATIGATGVALVAGVGIASAHIEPDPGAVEAGASATVSFGVEHGCDGSPTTELEFQVPDGVTDAVAVDKDGWTTSAEGDVVRFSDGNLDPETPDSFAITFTAPSTPGVINFPVVQTCETGSIAWIEIAAEGQPEPEDPAPAITVTDGPPTSADLAGEHEEEEATEGTTGASAATPTSTADSDDSSSTGVVVGIIIAVVVIGGVAAYVVRRRSSSGG